VALKIAALLGRLILKYISPIDYFLLGSPGQTEIT
jgi:hypothetical protein